MDENKKSEEYYGVFCFNSSKNKVLRFETKQKIIVNDHNIIMFINELANILEEPIGDDIGEYEINRT